MDSNYLHPYRHQHGGRDDERLVGLYLDEPGRHRQHRHHDETLPRSCTSSEREHRSHRSSDVTDEPDSDIRRSRSVVRLNHDQPRSRVHSLTSSRGGHSFRRPLSEAPATRKRYEHAIEKAISTGSAAAFHVRRSEGSWAGTKGLKVVGAASAAALIDYAFAKDPKNHKTRHIALSMIQSSVVEVILRSGEEDHDDHDDDDHHDDHHHYHQQKHHHRE